MGRLRANFARFGNPMQDCHLRKEPALRDYLPALLVILSDSEEWSVDQLKEMPSYGQAKGQFWSTRAFYAECAQYMPLIRQMTLNTSRREGCSMLFLGFICDE